MEIIQPLTVLHFTAFIICLLLGASCLRAPVTNARLSVALLLFAAAVWSLAKMIMHNPHTGGEFAAQALKYSFYFHTASFFMLFYVSLLIRTGGKYINNIFWLSFILLVSLPVAAFSLNSDLYLLAREPYGWATMTNPGLLTFYNTVFVGQIILSTVIMLSGIFSSDRSIRAIGRIMFICLLFPAAAYFILPPDNILANSADLMVLPLYIGYYISITKYGLFDIANDISLNTVIANIKEFLVLTAADGSIMQSNAAFKSSFSGIYNLSSAFADSTVYTGLILDVIRTGKNVNGTAEINLPGGGTMYVSVSLTPLKRFGRALAYLWVMSDITDRKALEYHLRVYNRMLEKDVEARTRELQQANEKLKKANEDLEHFSYASYHDLKEPIRQIIMHLQLLKKKMELDAGSEELVSFDLILAGAHRMNGLINAIRTYISLKEPDLSAESDLNDALKDALDSLSREISLKKASISSDRLPVILGSRPLFASVFTNLIGNALKYCEKTPEIKVKYDGRGKISIIDNGIGIEPEYLSKIFGMFERLHTQSKYEGSGMGLSITKKIIELHGGDIRAVSDGENGTVFSFTVIPIKASDK